MENLGTNIATKLTTNNKEKVAEVWDKVKKEENVLIASLLNTNIDRETVRQAFIAGYTDTEKTLKVPTASATTAMKNLSGILEVVKANVPFVLKLTDESTLVKLFIDYLGRPMGISVRDLAEVRKQHSEFYKNDVRTSANIDGKLKIYGQGKTNIWQNTVAQTTGVSNYTNYGSMQTVAQVNKQEMKKNEEEAKESSFNTTTNDNKNTSSEEYKPKSSISRAADWVAEKASNAWDTLKSKFGFGKGGIDEEIKTTMGQGRSMEDALELQAQRKYGKPKGIPQSGLISPSKFTSLNNKEAAGISFNRPGDTVKQNAKNSACIAGAISNFGAAAGVDIPAREVIDVARKNKEKNGGTPPSVFHSELKRHGIASENIHGKQKAINLLKEGKPLGLMGKYGSSNPHWMTATGITGDGKHVIVQDSDSKTPNRLYDANMVLGNSSEIIAPSSGGSKKGKSKRRKGRGKIRRGLSKLARIFGRSKYDEKENLLSFRQY